MIRVLYALQSSWPAQSLLSRSICVERRDQDTKPSRRREAGVTNLDNLAEPLDQICFQIFKVLDAD